MASLCTVVFALRLAGQIRFARYGAHAPEIVQDPHRHPIPLGEQGASIHIDPRA
jgi:hypothetical protein